MPPGQPGCAAGAPRCCPRGAAALLLLSLRLSLVAEVVDLQFYDLARWLRSRPTPRPGPVSLIGINELDIAIYE